LRGPLHCANASLARADVAGVQYTHVWMKSDEVQRRQEHASIRASKGRTGGL
jgi:molybdenum-dependent DNA-binding transcriptional regulator ModE